MDPRLQHCLEAGHTILVGSVDARGVPSVCRGVALLSADDFANVTTYVPLATSQDIVANVAATHRLAVTSTEPLSHSSTQFKGVVTSVRLAREDEAPLVRAQLEQTASVLDQLGLPKRVVRGIAHWPSFAIEMRVEEIYDQTPGPRAGSRLR